jgi:hypothetical protein
MDAQLGPSLLLLYFVLTMVTVLLLNLVDLALLLIRDSQDSGGGDDPDVGPVVHADEF